MSSKVELDSVSKSYRGAAGTQSVLDGLSFSIEPGEIVALVGPSGSGKTTLLNMLAGMLLPDAGRVRVQVDGEVFDLSSLKSSARARFRRRHLGYVFQFFNLVPTLTVAENVRIPLMLAHRMELEAEARLRLSDLGIAEKADEFPEHLSGGEQQRVAIARALAHRPALVLADEPTGNLDADNAEIVVQMLWRQVREIGSTAVIATHNARVAERADRRVVLGR